MPQTGIVKGTFNRSDRTPIVGLSAVFTPDLDPPLVRSINGSAVTTTVLPVTATTNDNGELIEVGATDPGVELVASINDELEYSGWTWTVTLNAPGLPPLSLTFTVGVDEEVDLGNVVRVPQNVGHALVAWRAAVQRVTEAAVDVAENTLRVQTATTAAQASAITATNAAGSAQVAKTAAQTHAATAAESAAAATAAATAAANSTSTAQGSLQAVTDAANAAATSRTAAAAAATDAATARAAAETARTAAQAAAGSAATSQGQAATSASQSVTARAAAEAAASQAATTVAQAAEQADLAATRAAAATASAQSASQAAQTATSRAQEAASSASAASASRDASAASAGTASTAATTAQAARNAAQTALDQVTAATDTTQTAINNSISGGTITGRDLILQKQGGGTSNAGRIVPALGVGTVTTGAAGSSAAATITGTAPDQTLNLTVPKGDQGIQGIQGPPNVLNIGTVTTAADTVPAAATITGTSPAQTLNLTLPRGDKGDKGDPGDMTPRAGGSIGTASYALTNNKAYLHGYNLVGNPTLTLSTGVAGVAYTVTVKVVQDATGGRTITWPGNVLWSEGIKPQPSAAPSSISIFHLLWDGAQWFGVKAGQNYA